jgi:hypothetical protein
MRTLKSVFSRVFHCGQKLILPLVILCIFTQPANANIMDAFNLAPFVPLVLETMINIATSLYKFFVGNGTGIIYILIYALAGFYIGMYLVKMYLPKDWLGFFGFSGGGEMWDGKQTGFKIAEDVLKPCLRAIIAAVILLQVKPVFVTKWLVDPFLEFGSFYTESLLSTVTSTAIDATNTSVCPVSIKNSDWLSERSCDFLIKPVDILSKENNRMIGYGFGFLKSGLRGLITVIPHGGQSIMEIITGILIITAFVSSNVFMALLIIQAIFDFCLSLIMYPFNVLTWVAKKSDAWFDILPPFKQIIDSLKKLVIAMIACAFILCINTAVVRALFNWTTTTFVVAAGGVSASNVPVIANNGTTFGQHCIFWISSILTFFLMQNIFNMTRERLDMYTKDTKKDLYKDVSKNAKTIWGKVKAAPEKIKTIINIGEKVSGKK